MSARSSVRRVIPLTFGWEELPITISIHRATVPTRTCACASRCPGVLCEVDGGWVLLDAGFNAPLVRDPILYQRFHSHGVNAELPPTDGDPLEWAFERVGIDPRDVVAVGLSHLHNDHAGGVKYFTGKVPIHCQRRELEFGLSDHPRPEQNAMFRFDFDDPAIDWRLADGDLEIAPGITAIATYGHTPGHQSFMVDLDDGGGFVFAFDAADLQRNIDEELSVGCLIDAEPEDSIAAIRRLKALAAERATGSCPATIPTCGPRSKPRWASRPSKGCRRCHDACSRSGAAAWCCAIASNRSTSWWTGRGSSRSNHRDRRAARRARRRRRRAARACPARSTRTCTSTIRAASGGRASTTGARPRPRAA